MALINPKNEPTTITHVPTNWVSVTPHDTNGIASGSDTVHAKVLYVGSTGDVEVITAGGQTVVFSGVPTGGYVYGWFSHVKNANTTASSILAGW